MEGQLYYNGFCKSMLWPLLHYSQGIRSIFELVCLPLSQFELSTRTFGRVTRREMLCLRTVWIFAQHLFLLCLLICFAAVKSQAREGDVVWVNDYHLFLVPQFLRHSCYPSPPKIGFFLHRQPICSPVRMPHLLSLVRSRRPRCLEPLLSVKTCLRAH